MGVGYREVVLVVLKGGVVGGDGAVQGIREAAILQPLVSISHYC